MEGRREVDYMSVLKESGIQVTYQRLAIYKALHSSTKHPSAEEIYQKVRKNFPMISLGTVYKSLERFSEAGLVQKVGAMADVSRYHTSADSHHHLFCVKCQSIQDIADPIGGNELSLPDGHGFEVLGHDVIIRGYCPQCVEK
jgi:Fur family transcriptional regulator, peroxide stress response regulator